MKRSFTTAVVALFLGAAPGLAWGQDVVVEGPGYPIGEGTVFHPSATLETGYISNVFYEDITPVATAVLRLIGAFSIASQTDKPDSEVEPGVESEGEEPEEAPPPNLDFRLGGHIILAGYLSSRELVRDQSDIAAAIDGHVVAFPQGDVSFLADDVFVRDARPKNFESFGNLNRDYNHLNLALRYQPGGRALSFAARYENTIDRFEGGGGVTPLANRMNHLLGARAEWQWLPITKFFFDASLGFFGPLGDSMGFKASSMPLRVQLGIGTALTEVTTLRGHVGYGNGFYSAGESFQNVIGGVELGYRYVQYGRVRLTLEYDFHDSLQANYYRDYALLAKLDHQFGLFVLGADGGVRVRGYRGIPAMVGPPSRDDLVLAATARGHYLYREWLALVARVEATADQTEYRSSVGDDPSYNRLEAYLGVSAAF